MPTTEKDTTTVRIPRRLVEEMHVIAEAYQRSMSAQLRVALEEYNRRELPKARRVLKEREQRMTGAES